MSTRGYLTIVDKEKNIQMAAFYPSSAYPSYLGIQILDAIANCAYPQFIDELRHDYPEELEMVDGIRRDWYVKGPDNQDAFFHDYAYELDGESQTLTIYHFGDKELTIKPEQLPLYRFIFENEEKLYYPISFDERSMTLKKDFYKEIRGMVRKGAEIADFQKIIDDNPAVLFMDRYRVKESWYQDSQSFNKYIFDTLTNRQLKICAMDSCRKLYLYVQTPFVRAPITHKSYTSVTAAEKAIAQLLRDRPDDVRATMRLFKDLEEYKEKIKEIFQSDIQSLDERSERAKELRTTMEDKLKEVKSKHHILGDVDNLLEREVRDAVYANFIRAQRRLEEKEKKPTLTDTIKAAENRVEGGQSEVKGIEAPTPEL